MQNLCAKSLVIFIALSFFTTPIKAEIDVIFVTSPMGFQYVTENVFQPRCYKCHSAAGGNVHGVNLETYSKVYALRKKIRDVALVRKIMPPAKAGGPLSAREATILWNWLNAGAPMENGTLLQTH